MTHTKTVLQALAHIPGATHHSISAVTGQTPKAVQRAIELLKGNGRVVWLKLGRINYYFDSQEQLDSHGDEVTARHDRWIDEIKRKAAAESKIRSAARWLKKKPLLAAQRKPPKPITLIQPKPVNKEKAARIKFGAQVAITPVGIKVQKCPGFTGAHRYEADPNCYGMGLREEWQKLRGAQHDRA